MLQRREAAHHFCLLTMAPLQFILIIVLQFEGVSGRTSVYRRPGDEAFLPCDRAASSDPTCSNTEWVYNRISNSVTAVVGKGGDVRRRLGTGCSLLIKNITAEDAGRYYCRLWDGTDTLVYLNVLTISASPADADPKTDGELTLECSLLRDSDFGPCQRSSFHWVDQTGAELLDEGVGFEFLGQKSCVSALKVKRQDDHSRRFTCQFFNKTRVEIEANYTLVSTGAGPPAEGLPPLQIYTIVGAAVGGVALLGVIAAVLIRCRRRDKVTEGVQKSGPKSQHQDEPESNMTYVSVNHAHQQASPNMKVKQEDQVTYSTVRAPERTEADSDPNSLYSNIHVRQ